VLDNGNAREGYRFYVEPHATDLVIEGNQIGDTRAAGMAQKCPIFEAEGAGSIEARNKNSSAGEVRIVRSAVTQDLR